jgi:hypothetical protein
MDDLLPAQLYSNQWDNNTPIGIGSWNVWQDPKGNYYADYKQSVDPDQLDKLEKNDEVIGPFDTLEGLFKDQGGMLFAVGPVTTSITSKVHSTEELAKCLFVEPSLVEYLDEDDEHDWTVLINDVEYHVNAHNGIGSPV